MGKFLEWVLKGICAFLAAALTIVIFLQVIYRFILRAPLVWSEDLAAFRVQTRQAFPGAHPQTTCAVFGEGIHTGTQGARSVNAFEPPTLELKQTAPGADPEVGVAVFEDHADAFVRQTLPCAEVFQFTRPPAMDPGVTCADPDSLIRRDADREDAALFRRGVRRDDFDRTPPDLLQLIASKEADPH